MVHGIDVKMYAYYVALAGSIAVFVLSIWMTRTPFGYALKAIRNDEQAARLPASVFFRSSSRPWPMGQRRQSPVGPMWSFRYMRPGTVSASTLPSFPCAMALLGGSGLLWDH